jgi:uncharacterized damage-inducible protein DinB
VASLKANLTPVSQELEYDRWANRLFLEAATRLDAEQFTRALGSSFASVRDTLVHMAWAEWLWLERWQGRSPQEYLNTADFPTLEKVRDYWSEIEARQERFIESLRPGSELRRVRYTNFQGVEWEYSLAQMIHHLATHSAYHRGQVATMLRQMGFVPPQTDYLVYLDTLQTA